MSSLSNTDSVRTFFLLKIVFSLIAHECLLIKNCWVLKFHALITLCSCLKLPINKSLAYGMVKDRHHVPRSWQRPAICTQRTSRSLMSSSGCFTLRALASSPAKYATLYSTNMERPSSLSNTLKKNINCCVCEPLDIPN